MGTVKKVPLRKCTGCGESRNKRDMIRVLKTTEDSVIIDATGRKNGRGAYICHDAACLEKAFKNHGLERSLKMQIPADVYEALKKELTGTDGK